MKTVFIAGATGYLGRFLCAHYVARGWHVKALVRNAESARRADLAACEFVVAQATRPDTLMGEMAGADLVISALGITRQRDGLDYWDVDFRANVNLLEEAQRAGVSRFAYIHVLNADKMRGVPMVDAKQAFADRLQSAPIASTIIAPSGFFSDMADFLTMAQQGRVWLFGKGDKRLNPIDGSDLARAVEETIAAKQAFATVGGPVSYTHRALAELAFAALDKPTKITTIPDVIRKLALFLVPWVTPRHVSGPAGMFLTAMGMDMLGTPHGTKDLAAHFSALAQAEGAPAPEPTVKA